MLIGSVSGDASNERLNKCLLSKEDIQSIHLSYCGSTQVSMARHRTNPWHHEGETQEHKQRPTHKRDNTIKVKQSSLSLSLCEITAGYSGFLYIMTGKRNATSKFAINYYEGKISDIC